MKINHPFNRIVKMYQKDIIDSSYLISILTEPCFKELLDVYLSKILVNGSVVPLQEFRKYKNLKHKIIELYKAFFHGEKLTDLEEEILVHYCEIR